MRQPAPELFSCPNCGAEVEIWSDEFRRPCPRCHKMVLRPGGMSCLEWCKQARQCVGEAAYANWSAGRCLGLKQRLVEALERHFGPDPRPVEHARAVLAEAELLLAREAADWHIVVPAALLHDIGGEARVQLLRLGLQLEEVEEVCDIIGRRHSPRGEESANFKVVHDAESLVELDGSAAARPRAELPALLRERLLTAAGRSRAEELFLSA